MKAPQRKSSRNQLLDLPLRAHQLLAISLMMSMAGFAPISFSANATERPAGNDSSGQASASATSGSPTASSPDILGDYHLAPGDHIDIVVFDQPQLSGDFIVDGGGTVLLPLAGPVSLSGLTLAEAQKLVQDQFADGILVQPAVNVRMTDYRPIFVTGDVRKPGSYKFNIGEPVKAAIAEAGGQGEPLEQNLGSAASDYIAADQRLRQLHADYAILSIRKARLEAQRDERENFVVPTLVGLRPGNVDFDRAYSSESDVFSRLTEMYRAQIQALRNQQPQMQTEVNAVMDQIVKQKEHLAIVNGRLTDLQGLFDKGLLRKEILINAQIEKSLVEGQVLTLQAQVAHLRQNMGELEAKIGDLKASYVRQTLTELQDTSQRLDDVEASLGPARKLLELKARGAGTDTDDPEFAIRISRVREGSMVTFDATDESILSPGDVVEVKLKRRPLDSLPSMSTQAIRDVDPASLAEEDLHVSN